MLNCTTQVPKEIRSVDKFGRLVPGSDLVVSPIIRKCVMSEYILHMNMTFSARSYVTYEYVIWPNLCYKRRYDLLCLLLFYAWKCVMSISVRGARWLSGRVSDSGARGPGFETYRRRVVSLSKTLYSPKVLVNYPGSDGSVPIWLKNCWLGR